MLLASQVEGSSRRATWPASFSMGASVTNVIRVPCLKLHAFNHCLHVYASWEVRQLIAEGYSGFFRR